MTSDGSHGESVLGLSHLRIRVCQNRCLDTIRVLSSDSYLEKGSEGELAWKSGPCLQPQTLAVRSTCIVSSGADDTQEARLSVSKQRDPNRRMELSASPVWIQRRKG